LTLTLEGLLSMPNLPPNLLLSLYTSFIKHFEKKLKPLSLIQFLAKAIQQASLSPKEAIEFLKPFATLYADQVSKKKADEKEEATGKKETPGLDIQEAFILSSMTMASYQLAVGQSEECKTAMDECAKKIEEFPGLDASLHACFYKVASDYYKVIIDASTTRFAKRDL
jgi:26S proteasome regulatory subunit N9